MTGFLARIAAGRRRAVLVLASGCQGLLWVPLARSSGGVLGVALYTERRAARAGVMAADLGTSRRPARHVLGGFPALFLAWVALWGRPTELGALASSPGQSGKVGKE